MMTLFGIMTTAMHLKASLDDLEPWREAHLAAVTEALYLADRPRAEAALAAAWQALQAGGLAEQERDALEYYIIFSQVQAQLYFAANDAERRQAALRALEALQRPPKSALGDLAQGSVTLYLRVSMLRRGMADFPPQEFHALCARIPEAERHDYYWHQVANWAFHQRDAELLGEALATYSVSPPENDAESFWQRTNLMYHLVKGDAREEDVRQYIARLRLHSMVAEFDKHIWPRIVECGLPLQPLREAFEARRREVEQGGRQLPQSGPRTRSLLALHRRPAV